MAKTLNTRVVNKHDISTNWDKAENFIPLKGEIIVYDDLNKLKIGDGETLVKDLAFVEAGLGEATAQGGEIFNDYENNEAIGENSHASGSMTKATTANQTVVGVANREDNSALFIVGNGDKIQLNDDNSVMVDENENPIPKRSNAFVVHHNGSASTGEFAHAFAVGATASGGSASGHKLPIDEEHVTEEAWDNGEKFTAALGKYSHAEGQITLTVGHGSHAEGNGTKAKGNYSHAEGLKTTASGPQSHTEGNETTASAQNTHAEGYQSKAISAHSHAEGRITEASGTGAHSEGSETVAAGYASHAEGTNTQATGEASHAEGLGSYAAALGAHAEGQGVAKGDCAHAEGYSKALGAASHAEGLDTKANGGSSHSEGYHTHANGSHSHAEGQGTEASGEDAHAEGYHTIAEAHHSHAAGIHTKATALGQTVVGIANEENDNALFIVGNGAYSGEKIINKSNAFIVDADGNAKANGEIEDGNGRSMTSLFNDIKDTQNKIVGERYNGVFGEIFNDYVNNCAPGAYAHAEGRDTKAVNDYSHAEGYSTTAFGVASHSEGQESQAKGIASHAEGFTATAEGDYSHAEGFITIAKGVSSHAEGAHTKANGSYSHAEGSGTIASGVSSHSEGSTTLASGEYSHAEGFETKASGINAHAEGRYTKATAAHSHAGGLYTIASGYTQTAIGKYNEENDNALFIVGNGTGTSDAERSNAFTVDTSGNGVFAGDVKAIDIKASGEVEDGFGNKLSDICLKKTEEGGYIVNQGTPYGGVVDASAPYAIAIGACDEYNVNSSVVASGYGSIVISNGGDGETGSVARGAFSLAKGNTVNAYGAYSTVMGGSCTADGDFSVVKGYYSSAKGDYSTATGVSAKAEGDYSLARGHEAEAIGRCSIAISGTQDFGKAVASGDYSIAIGHDDDPWSGYMGASGKFGIAIGNACYADNDHSVAVGTNLWTNGNYQILFGKFANNKNTDLFVIGNGTYPYYDNESGMYVNGNKNAFSVSDTGAVTCTDVYKTTGADYAEYFEWADGNQGNEDRVGYLVALDGEHIRKANEGDKVFGITSATPAILGDTYDWYWRNKYLTDDFGRIQYHDVEIFDKKTGESLGIETQPILNPDFDPAQEYTPRSQRPEWSAVGFMGKLYLRDDGSCIAGGYVKASDGGIATYTSEETNIRVLKRIKDNLIYVFIK